MDQAGRQPLRRHPQPDGRPLAQGHQGQGRDPHPVPPRHRRRADHPRGVQDPRAEGRQRHRRRSRSRACRCSTRSTTRTAKGRRTTQYFEMFANRAIYHDGWVACSQFGLPWDTAGRGGGFLNAPWELYNVDDDFSQADDLAAQEPGEAEGAAGQVPRGGEEVRRVPARPAVLRANGPEAPRRAASRRTSWTYYGNNVWLPEPVGPQLFPRGHTITAELTIPKGGAEGVVACCRIVLGRAGRSTSRTASRSSATRSSRSPT